MEEIKKEIQEVNENEVKKGILRNQKGFTLIEIIAVLVILGILAAVGVPKYVDMQAQAKQNARMGQVAEMKSSLNLGYASYFLANQTPPTGSQAIAALGMTAGTATTIGTAPDIWSVLLTATDNSVGITIGNRDGDSEYS
ncbi:MAG: prepilin-type N-terminal cleavage/methylation domain-containing protein, partial [Desulfamplus sp.]|nr:prepilin-type N-terminal cleavage/methylation domain-containing protein [Desulfamplus sp.]